jgi:hypothetical protein
MLSWSLDARSVEALLSLTHAFDATWRRSIFIISTTTGGNPNLPDLLAP